MTFPKDSTCVIKMKYSEEEISAVLAESEQERKRLRKLGKVMETVAAYRLQKMKHFQAMQKLATWRRTYGYDRDDSWMYGTRPLASEVFTASLWEEVNALKEALDTCVCVGMEGTYEEGRMNPEPTELESPSTGTGLEIPGQQRLLNGETGRTTADDYLLVGMGSNQRGHFSTHGTRWHANRYSHGTGKFIKHYFAEGRLQIQRRGERKRREQAI